MKLDNPFKAQSPYGAAERSRRARMIDSVARMAMYISIPLNILQVENGGADKNQQKNDPRGKQHRTRRSAQLMEVGNDSGDNGPGYRHQKRFGRRDITGRMSVWKWQSFRY